MKPPWFDQGGFFIDI